MLITIWTVLLVRSCLCSATTLIGAIADEALPKMPADWTDDPKNWLQASHVDNEEDLWSKPNDCDPRVLHSSAPLTLLFAVSEYWPIINQQRQRSSSERAGQTFEVHLLGSAYPFEGRSDWSIFASRRPKSIKKVRIVLILGTPWQSDNVPMMKTKEFDESMSLLQNRKSMGLVHNRSRDTGRGKKPEAGKVVAAHMECQNKSAQAQEDKQFRKADLCRDHGDGLEVVCIEKYYQDVADELPVPDAVAMFSPGFPQLARRSWDEVLRRVLLAKIPIIVGDILRAGSLTQIFQDGKEGSGEGNMTQTAMQAYGARRLGFFQNPFPILSIGKLHAFAKNGVLQVFHGRHEGAEPFVMPSEEEVQRRKEELQSFPFEKYFKDEVNAKEIRESLLISTSTAYDDAMRQHYLPMLREFFENAHPLSSSSVTKLHDLGLTLFKGEKAYKSKHWGLKDWFFIFQNLDGAENIF